MTETANSNRYDRIYGQIVDLAPKTRPATVIEALPIAGDVTTWIVETAFHNEEFVVFLQAIESEGQLRIVLPGKVTAALVRQQEALKRRITDRRSRERIARDRERERVKAARSLLEKQREARRARKAAREESAS